MIVYVSPSQICWILRLLGNFEALLSIVQMAQLNCAIFHGAVVDFH